MQNKNLKNKFSFVKILEIICRGPDYRGLIKLKSPARSLVRATSAHVLEPQGDVPCG